MTNTNEYSRRYEMEMHKGIYGKIGDSLNKIHGNYGDHLLVRDVPEGIVLIERNFEEMKEIVKIHAKEPEKAQSHLENITGIKLSDYRVH